jgi:DNA invertase Pin-like site-specific DNA recombinase
MQTRELREYAERRGWTVAGEYVDVGISGTKETRPQLDRLRPMHTAGGSMPLWFGSSIASRGQ